MTNKERWLKFTEGLSSPQNYVEWSFRFLICASLQRRVWLSASNQPCFPNLYVILVGQPGIGKGICINKVTEILRHWKKEDAKLRTEGMNDVEKQAIEAMAQKELEEAQAAEYQGKNKNADIIKPLLIPVAADATTYEALVQAVAESYRRIQYKEWSEQQQKIILKSYGHSSLYFALQELSSLLRKRTDDTVNYLLGLYDCPTDYEYITKTKGKDRVRRGCLNILAATTPSFMQSTFDERLTGEGFTSRVFFIYAQKNRKNQFFMPDVTPEQEEHKKVILEHVMKLTQLYGKVEVDKETWDYLQAWWDEHENNKDKRINNARQLIPYYARKNIHVMKVAMAIHFAESTEMKIPLSTFKEAIDVLNKEEQSMHLAITLESSNPIAKVAKAIIEYLRSGKKNFIDIHIETHDMCDKKTCEEALDFLVMTGQCTIKLDTDEITGKQVQFWELTKEGFEKDNEDVMRKEKA